VQNEIGQKVSGLLIGHESVNKPDIFFCNSCLDKCLFHGDWHFFYPVQARDRASSFAVPPVFVRPLPRRSVIVQPGADTEIGYRQVKSLDR
jgi:hypothetical protein